MHRRGLQGCLLFLLSIFTRLEIICLKGVYTISLGPRAVIGVKVTMNEWRGTYFAYCLFGYSI